MASPILSAVCLLFALVMHNDATQLSLTANPSIVTNGLTDTLTLRCSLLNTTLSETTERPSVSNTSFDVKQVNSIIVFRGSANREIPIARIEGSNPAEAITDTENLQAEGVLSPDVSTDPRYLELVWTKPRERQDGQYTCEAHVLDTLGRGSVLEAKAEVEVKSPGIPELITEIINLENQVNIRKTETIKLENRIDSLENAIHDNYGDVKKSYRFSREATLKASHIEQGEVRCSVYTDVWIPTSGTETKIDKTVRFQNPYTDIPVVSAGLSFVDTDRRYNARYWFKVHDVSRTGFTITCYTCCDSITYQVGVRWTSIVA